MNVVLMLSRKLATALSGVVQWLGHLPANQKVTHQCFSPSLSPSLPLSLKNKEINKHTIKKNSFLILHVFRSFKKQSSPISLYSCKLLCEVQDSMRR